MVELLFQGNILDIPAKITASKENKHCSKAKLFIDEKKPKTKCKQEARPHALNWGRGLHFNS